MASFVLLLVVEAFGGGTEGAQRTGAEVTSNVTLPAMVFQQFELDIEPKVFLKPSRVSSTEALTHNESQEFSFSEAATKGMQPLRETVSEFEMLARAGKDNLRCYLCSLLPLPRASSLHVSFLLASLGTCIVTLNVFPDAFTCG